MNFKKKITILFSMLFFFLFVSVYEGNAGVAPDPLDPQTGYVKTNVGKAGWTQQKWDDWLYDVYDETRGSLYTNNVAYAYANVNTGNIKLTVRRDSSDSTGFENVWHGCSPSWASGALYDSFSFSDAVDLDKVYVNVFYDGFYDVADGSSRFTIKLWGDADESNTTIDNVAFTGAGCFSVPLMDIARNVDDSYNIGVEILLEATGNSAMAEFSDGFVLTLDFSSEKAVEGWMVAGTAFNETAISNPIPVPPAFMLFFSGIAGIAIIKTKLRIG